MQYIAAFSTAVVAGAERPPASPAQQLVNGMAAGGATSLVGLGIMYPFHRLKVRRERGLLRHLTPARISCESMLQRCVQRAGPAGQKAP